MRASRLLMLLGAFAIVLPLVACQVSFSTANIGDAWMSTDEEGEERSTVFGQDAVFYAQVDLRNAPDDTELKAVWVAVEVEDTEPNLVMNETEFATGTGLVHFRLSNSDLWPHGQYKVDIYLGDKLAKTLEFEVR